MSSKSTIVSFLNELHSDSVQDVLQQLSIIVENLEDKNDPERIEMEIVDISYQLVEKIEMLKAVLKKYSGSEHILKQTKLEDLYESKKGSGTTTLFE